MPEMPTTTEETREKIKGIVLASRSTLFVLIESIVAILVVDAAGFGIREGVIGFGDVDELLMCSVVPTMEQGVSELAAIRLPANLGSVLTDFYPGGTSC